MVEWRHLPGRYLVFKLNATAAMRESRTTALSRKSGCVTCILYAVTAVAAACSWQAVRVRHRYHGNWTALYVTGSRFPVPPALERENISPLVESAGYDGQFYHYIAHDPFFTEGFAAYIDNPRVRYRRILLPALAFLLALGRQQWIDPSYYAVTLLFVFMGVYWTAAFASRGGYHPAWGLAFLLAPATLVSLSRLTVDISLVALSVGYAVYSTEEPSWQLFLVLTLAPLARETGIILPTAYSLYSLSQFRIRTAAETVAVAAVPCMGWWLFVDSRTSPDRINWISWPFRGLLHRIVTPPIYPAPPVIARTPLVADYLALAGLVVAFCLCMWLLFRLAIDPIAIACFGFLALGMLLVYPDAWQETTGFGRVFSPFFFCCHSGECRGALG